MSDHAPAFEPEVLDQVVESGERVSLLRVDGREFHGRIDADHRTAGLYRIVSGKRGRPPRPFTAQDVASLTIHVPAK